MTLIPIIHRGEEGCGRLARALVALAVAMAVGACGSLGPLGGEPDLADLVRQAEERAARGWPAEEPVPFGLAGWMALTTGERVTVSGSLVRQGEDFRLDTKYTLDGRLRHNVALYHGGRSSLFFLVDNQEASFTVRDGGQPDLALRWYGDPTLLGIGARLESLGTLDERPTWPVSLEGDAPRPGGCVIPTVLTQTGEGLAVIAGSRCHQATSLATRWTSLDLDAESLELARLSGWQTAKDGTRQSVTLRWSGHQVLGAKRWSPTSLEVQVGDQVVATIDQTEFAGPLPSFDPVDVKIELMLEAQVNGDEAFFAQPLDWTSMLLDTIAPDREQELPSARVLEALSLARGERVADVGAGAGFLTFAMARAVGPEGEVVAVDILPQAVALLEERTRDPKVCPHRNVRPILSTFSDPKLGVESVDAVVMCGLDFERYPRLSEARMDLLRQLFASCRPNGRLLLLDKHWGMSDDPSVGLTADMLQFDYAGPVAAGIRWDRADPPQHAYRAQLRANVEAVGFTLEDRRLVPGSGGEWGWYLFRKPASGGEIPR